MKSSVPVLLLALAAAPAVAAIVSCPDLGKAAQVAACPAEEELRHTFTGYCADDARAYRGETGVCKDFTLYRALKNVALWEAGDGAFSAYVSCDLAPTLVKAASVTGIRVARQGKLTLLVCHYAGGIEFTRRSREECRPADATACAADRAACSADCN